jgi:hypothetical protein
VSTLDQVDDIFTKGHTADRFCFLHDKLKVAPPISLRGGVKGIPENQQQLQIKAPTSLFKNHAKTDGDSSNHLDSL